MSFEQPFPNTSLPIKPESPESKERPEKRLEDVLSGLLEKEQAIVKETKEKLNPEWANLYDSTLLSIYGPMERLKKYGFADQESIDKYAQIGHNPTSADRSLIDSMTQRRYFLKEHEDALLIGGYEDKEEMANQLVNIKKKRQNAGKIINPDPDTDIKAIVENNRQVKEEDKKVLTAIRNKFVWVDSKFPFRERFAQDFPNREAIDRMLGSKDMELGDLGFAGNYFGELLDMSDLHEAGVVNLDKMNGSELVNLYEQLANRRGAPVDKLKIANDMEKLRDAYLYGIISSRQEYLTLVKQSFKKNKFERGF